MKFSEQWLREWVNPPIDTRELAERLTMAGLEVDSVEPAAPDFEQVVVAEVLEVSPHPDADKLRVCRVDDGSGEPLQIVCGAPNVRAGMKAPLARVGGVMPGGMKIRRAKLRGVESFGMLCSARELGLSEDHAGLMDLPADAPVGQDIRDYLQLDDALIDVDLTPNRADCLGILGIAREVGALTRSPVTVPRMDEVPAAIADVFAVEVKEPAACPRYLGRVIRGVNPEAPTPLWMQERLRRSGLRSLGPLVDVTNYVLLELGQPMHAFDLARLEGAIHVRNALPGERLVLLDEREVTLDTDTLVIADARQALAIAGVMGGEASGCSDRTRDVFLECAFFTPERLAGVARRYGLQTDASYRFERGVDPWLQRQAMERATRLLLDIAGGEAGPVEAVTRADFLPERAAIHLRAPRIGRLLGLDMPRDEVEDILGRLGCSLEPLADGWRVTPPGFRFDMAIEADLIEELGRVHGYDRLPERTPTGVLGLKSASETRLPRERLRATLVDRGYREAITYSFIDPELAAAFDPDHTPVALANPISSEMAVMRSSLWPGLAGVLRHNLNRQQERVRIFESGLNFISQDNEIKQIGYLGVMACGSRCPEQWGVPSEPIDFHDVKGDVEALLALTGRAADFEFRPDRHPALHPGRCARILEDGRPVGWIGSLHPALAGRLDLPANTQLAEIELAALESARPARFAPISRFPALRRDLAVVVDATVPWGEIRRVVSEAGGETLKETRLFDVYMGQGVEKGRKSIALGLILQDSSRTLTDQDIESVVSRVTAALREQLGASLRE
ncbi:phenylalanine--tRNA ligase subunit beta [Thiohalobacter sp.]|uniref:phenylalanine--tRNA ligase subunit beta n=1 Tax=Thiohalobacter sp. TaxID=2025948 RepID=UPI002623FB48|nr:phenylalanine--tRNA ligase subunit beta [Thiohalobacter sp.]